MRFINCIHSVCLDNLISLISKWLYNLCLQVTVSGESIHGSLLFLGDVRRDFHCHQPSLHQDFLTNWPIKRREQFLNKFLHEIMYIVVLYIVYIVKRFDSRNFLNKTHFIWGLWGVVVWFMNSLLISGQSLDNVSI